jgi:hypothetical protein
MMIIAASVAFLPLAYANCWMGDRLGEQLVLPALQARAGPIAVGAFDVRGAVLGDLGQQPLGDRRVCVVRIDEHRELGGVLVDDDRCPLVIGCWPGSQEWLPGVPTHRIIHEERARPNMPPARWPGLRSSR